MNKKFKKILSFLLTLVIVLGFAENQSSVSYAAYAQPTVQYQVHVQKKGWIGAVTHGAAGTTGESLRLEAIRISVSGVQGLGVRYQTHVQNYGWQSYVSDGATAGTTGENKRLEAIRIELTGSEALYYNIYYRVHVQDYGWLNWAKNGQAAGTQNYGKRLEAIEIRVLPKGSAAPTGGSGTAFTERKAIVASAHVQSYGWLSEVDAVSGTGITLGTTGKGKRLEAISLKPTGYDMNVEYSVHVQNSGWSGYVKNGQTAGTTGQGKRLEAVKIRLTGTDAAKYDIYYRVHVQDLGWMDWVKNGEMAGTTGRGLRMEALEIRLEPNAQNTSQENEDSEAESMARKTLNIIGWDLRAAFNYSSTMPYYTNSTDVPAGYSNADWYAMYGFWYGRGNCYNQAATFYQMAKLLGYDVHYLQGYIPRKDGSKVTHGWCEINMDGGVYVFDPNFTYGTGKDGYHIYYGKPGTWRYIDYQRLN